MKKLISFIALLIITSIGFAQVISNSGFENWSLTTQGWEDPNNWTSSNTTVLGGDSAVYKTNESYSGSYAAKIRTVTLGFAGLPVAGILVNGSINFDQTTSIDDLIAAGTPISSTPSELHGFYKYTPFNVGDSAQIRVIVKNYNVLTQKRDTVAIANKNLPPSSSYSAFTVNLDELLPGIDPDSIIIIFFSDNPDAPKGGILLVDEISLGYATGTDGPNTVLRGFEVFPNPTNGLGTVIGLPEEPTSILVYSSLGALIQDVQLNQSAENKIDLSPYPAGVYFVQVYTGNTILIQKLIKQ